MAADIVVRHFNCFCCCDYFREEHRQEMISFHLTKYKEPDRWLWKIDYYDKSLQAEAEDPADPETTQRILTLMLPEDY